MANFAHLHMHSSFSILDSISKIPDIVSRLKEFGHTHALLSDHGSLGGVPEFFSECKKAKIKAIAGSEFYMVPDAVNHKEDADLGIEKKTSFHLILMAMNDEGWKNIKLLSTKANKQFYYVPRVDYNNLREHSNGIICLTACLKGIVPYHLSIEKYAEAAEHAKTLKSIFGDRFYLEVQDGGINIQLKVNKAIRALGKHLEIPIVGCQDAHYIDRNDVIAHEAIWAIRTKNNFDKPVGYGKGKEYRPYYSTREFWLKDMCHILGEDITTEDGIRRKTDLLQSELELSQIIAERIGDVTMDSKMHLPRYEFVPDVARGCSAPKSCGHEHKVEDTTSFNYLTDLVYTGYEVRFGKPVTETTDEHKQRLVKELTDIRDAKLADYFLIVWDIVSWAKSKGIPVGPGRGSAAGSLVSYCLGITKIDPMKYGLIWERFFNRGRIGSLADIDLDFSKSRREEVITYIKNRFGADRVAQMVTFNTLATKAALKDTNKVLGSKGMSFDAATVMTRFVPDKVDNLKDALEKSEKLKEYADKNPMLFEIAAKIEGSPKSAGKHAAGIIISDESFDTGSVPLRWDPKKEEPITEWDGETMDKMKYLKLDVLGLKTLDVLDGTARDAGNRNG